MGSIYNQLTAAERTALKVMRAEGASQSFAAEHLGRNRSTICRELARNVGSQSAGYDAILADARARDQRATPAPNPKLGPDTPLFAVVHDQLRADRTGAARSPTWSACRCARPRSRTA